MTNLFYGHYSEQHVSLYQIHQRHQSQSLTIMNISLVNNFLILSFHYKTMRLPSLNADFSALSDMPPSCYHWSASSFNVIYSTHHFRGNASETELANGYDGKQVLLHTYQ